MKKKLPNSIRKHIRKEKARIRREIFSVEKQQEKIKKLYQKFDPIKLPSKPPIKVLAVKSRKAKPILLKKGQASKKIKSKTASKQKTKK